MAGVLVAALCVPEVFDDRGLLFAGAYAAVRMAHIALFTLASRDDPQLRRSVPGLAVSTAVSVGLLIAAAFTDGMVQGGLWVLAVTLDLLGPLLFGADGWSLVPEHFAERHGLILLIALGESIVAIGLAVDTTVDTAEVAASVLGVVVAAALWWLYFDVVALVAAHHLAAAPPGRVQNSMARDSYSYLHLPMVAGIVLIALGLKKVIGHVGDPLHTVPAAALLGGTAMYLLGHVAFRLRNVRTLNRQRTLVALVCLAGIPAAAHRPGLAVLTALTCALVLLLVYEVVRFGEARARMRRELRHL